MSSENNYCDYCKDWQTRTINNMESWKDNDAFVNDTVIMNFGGYPCFMFITKISTQGIEINYCPWCGRRLSDEDVINCM